MCHFVQDWNLQLVALPNSLISIDLYCIFALLDHKSFGSVQNVTITCNFFGCIAGYRSQLFQSYDKGSVANMLSYGQLSPPLYDLSSFPTSFPVQIFFGGVDGLADPTDSQLTLSGLPSGLNKEIHNIPDYGHLDFIIGYQAHVDVYPLVASFLSTHWRNLNNSYMGADQSKYLIKLLDHFTRYSTWRGK